MTDAPDAAALESLHEAARQDVERLRREVVRADHDTLRLMFLDARTHYGWQDRPVSDVQLRQIYDLMKWGPTSMNQQPMRLVFVKSAQAKEKLKPALMDMNVEKVMTAPVTAIIGYDLEFYERLPETFPHDQSARDIFAGKEALTRANAVRNGTLQGAYFMLAARALGIDTGPMSGFNTTKVDELFFAGTAIKSNFLCNLGYGETVKIFRRLPRLDFDDVAEIL